MVGFFDLNRNIRFLNRIKADTVSDEIKLLYNVFRMHFDKKNRDIDLVIDVDGIKFKLVDLESLCVVSPTYEKWMWNYFKPKVGDVFVDVGAHIGKYSLNVAKMVQNQGKVVAIEPEPENFDALLKGITLNRFSNVMTHNVACWDKEESLFLYVNKTNDEERVGSHLAGKGGNSVKMKSGLDCVKVLARPLDQILNEVNISKVDWLKIDAEHAEYEVLKGAKQTIKKSKPRILLETFFNSPPRKKVFEFMEKFGYNNVPMTKHEIFFYPGS